jgi:hypothetical protein
MFYQMKMLSFIIVVLSFFQIKLIDSKLSWNILYMFVSANLEMIDLKDNSHFNWRWSSQRYCFFFFFFYNI